MPMHMPEEDRLSPAPLPDWRTSFIGRGRELEQLQSILSGTRLLTLTGVAGCGKTRLALQIANAARAQFGDAVAFVDLVPVRDLDGIQEAMAHSLGLPQRSAGALARQIGDARVLIVIDNAEHVIDPAAAHIDHLLRACCGAAIIVTSRELLDIEGETRWQVEPLKFPRIGTLHEVQVVGDYDAVRLFCVRARAHLPAFRLTDGNAQLVAAICRRLDGIPLALELAAARVRTLGLNDILARLDDQPGILSHGRGTGTPRHRTMQAALDWSYELLSDAERLLVQRLSRFADTFDLQAAEAVCSGPGVPREAVSDLLGHLVDKCFLIAHPQSDGTLRYGQMEVLRQYGRSQSRREDLISVTERHSQYYAGLLHTTTIGDADLGRRTITMTLDYRNVQLALDDAIRNDPDLAIAMVEDLQWWWLLQGAGLEAIRRIETLLADRRTGGSRLARLCASAHSWALVNGDHQAAARYADQALSLIDDDTDTALRLWIANILGITAAQHRDWQSAERHFRLAKELCALIDDDVFEGRPELWGHGLAPTRSRMLSMTRNNLAHLLLVTGRHDEARRECESALASLADVEIPNLAPWLLSTHGQVLLSLGHAAEAGDRFRDVLAFVAARGADSLAVSPLAGLACVAAQCSQHAACLTLAAAAHGAAQRGGLDAKQVLDDAASVVPVAEAQRRSRSTLGKDGSEEAWARGKRMSLSEALSFVRSLRWSDVDRPVLTPRQTDVVRMVAKGFTDKQIAIKLCISVRTVEVHLANVRSLLGLQNRAQIAVWYVSTNSEGSAGD